MTLFFSLLFLFQASDWFGKYLDSNTSDSLCLKQNKELKLIVYLDKIKHSSNFDSQNWITYVTKINTTEIWG